MLGQNLGMRLACCCQLGLKPSTPLLLRCAGSGGLCSGNDNGNNGSDGNSNDDDIGGLCSNDDDGRSPSGPSAGAWMIKIAELNLQVPAL